ncbi:thioesterase family protein [Natrialba sp. INN-245]|uniref:acyl-CoA thioesterase n=1 Tax=Natrialba sp. INN-245 TaxID=2690967 RepID=UPI001311429B|nr:thioesterase family protein [Natrialba sp. INN-245]MWV40621.1 acyl-CoA thioesterase [Natrialba sp. INN-245]
MNEFEYEVDLEVRLRDIDFMGHVNNAVYATYLEQARDRYFTDVLEVSLADVGTVLANLEIDYAQPIEADESVTVALGVRELGDASIPIEYEVRADSTVAATARTVQVVVDAGTGESQSVPSTWRSRIESRR